MTDLTFFRAKLSAAGRLMRLDRPIGIYLLLWPALWSLWLAGDGQPSRLVLLVFVAGVVLTRSAGCVLNDSADRGFDAQVERTKNRPLVTGEVSVPEARVLAALLLLAAFALVLLLNAATVLMSVVALALAASYPWMKRIMDLPQVYLGVAFGWAIPMAWVAQTAAFPPLAVWLLYAASICWTTAYDTIYALADRDDDLHAGVRSAAILFGRQVRWVVALLQGASLVLLALAGLAHGLGFWFYAALPLAGVCFVRQHWLIRDGDGKAFIKAFSENAWVGLIVFVGLLIDLLPD